MIPIFNNNVNKNIYKVKHEFQKKKLVQYILNFTNLVENIDKFYNFLGNVCKMCLVEIESIFFFF